MTFSVLMSALMGASLAALVGALVVDALRGQSDEATPPRVGGPTLRSGQHGRLIHRWDCPREPHQPSAAAARVPRDRTPRSCKR